MQAHESVIQTAGLTKVFKDFWHRQRVVAVDRLDLDIHANEVFGLLGPNGSGKSTTIKMLLGLLYPTRGRIRVLGKPPTDVAIKERIGYLPEESYLYRFLNARETLDYYARLFQIPRQERHRRVDQLLEMVGLQRESRRRVGEYSKGMARRIGLAQALINDPDLLILDEPTTGLDPIGTREMKDLIAFLNKEKRKTILLCSHLLADVEDVCQRVTILYGGKRQAMGDIHDLLSRENLTQITAERLSEGTIARIRELIEQDGGRQVLSIKAPSDRLETFFLRIVREAQQARQHTSGATATGGQIASFLAGGKDVVESLVAAAARTPEAEAVTAAEFSQPPAEEIIEDLVTASHGGGDAKPGEYVEEPAAAPAVDEDFLQKLVRPTDSRSSDKQE
jgi:ABC-2 type transport system ATP-binding protein